MRKGLICIGILFFLCIFIVPSGFAQEKKSSPFWGIDSIHYQAGFFTGALKEQDRLKRIYLNVGLGWDVKPLFKKLGWKNPVGIYEIMLEPFINPVIAPYNDVEVGTCLCFKIGPRWKRLAVYFKGGAGPMYTSLHTREQSTQFNYMNQVGGGFHFFLSENKAFTLEYRWTHYSNASIKHPNAGVDAHGGLMGLSLFF